MQSTQSPIFEPTHLPSLPKPSPVDQWVFESPLLVTLLLIVIGLLVFALLRQTKHSKRVGLPVLAFAAVLAGMVYSAGVLVTNDREHLEARSRELVQATATADQTQLARLLDERAAVKTAFGSASSKDKIISLVTSRAATSIQSASTKEVRIGIYGQQVARTQIKVRVDGDMFPSNSWWQVDWTRPDTETTQWVVTDIKPLWIQGINNPEGT